MIEAKCLLIEVAEQVKRLHADVGSRKRPLQQNPKVLQPIRVDFAAHMLGDAGLTRDVWEELLLLVAN
jgi:hypothetical protein